MKRNDLPMKLGVRGLYGFTLIEIMIVLAVLAAVVTPNVAGFLSRGK